MQVVGVIRGLVLAGGKSLRFGSDKAQAVYRGMSLLNHAVALLNDLDLKPVVVTRRNTGTSDLKCVTVYDQLPDQGPLGGIDTAMRVFRDVSFLVLTCDMPHLTRELLSELLSAHQNSHEVTLFSIHGRLQPFPGIYGASLRKRIRTHLTKGDRSMRRLLETTENKRWILSGKDTAVFHNVNFMHDLAVF